MTRPTKFDLMRNGRRRAARFRERLHAEEKFEQMRMEAIEAGWDVDSKLEVMQQMQELIAEAARNPPRGVYQPQPPKRWWQRFLTCGDAA